MGESKQTCRKICKYCELIHSFESSYPLRRATNAVKSDYPRCDWHWRFICSTCGRPRHFNGISWCEKSHNLICLSCTSKHKTVPRRFWDRKYYYAIYCDNCKQYHPALDYLEFRKRHPWQLHRDMRETKIGLDRENSLRPAYVSSFSHENISEKQVAEAWDRIANRWDERYSEHGDMNREFIIDPAIFRVIGSVKDLAVLDAGCGGGYLSRLLMKRGAHVVGVDVSKKFIEIARQKEEQNPLGIIYHVGSVSNLSMLQDESFDLIVSNIVLADVKDFQKAIHEFARVLRPDRKLVFSNMHPCFSSAPVNGWVRVPPDSDRMEDWVYWKVDQYFERSVETWRFHDWPQAYGFHRPLSDYMNALFKNGFVVTDFEEPVPTKKTVREHRRQLSDGERIPWFLIIGAKKIDRLLEKSRYRCFRPS